MNESRLFLEILVYEANIHLRSGFVGAQAGVYLHHANILANIAPEMCPVQDYNGDYDHGHG